MYSSPYKGRGRWFVAGALAILLAGLAAAGCNGATPDTTGGGSTGGGSGGPPPTDTPSPVSTAMPPAAPSDITGDVVAVYDVPVGWTDNSNNEDGFNIYRQRIDVLSEKEKAGSSGHDLTQFLDANTYCGATYQYTVASYNTAGESPATTCWQITLPQCPFPSNVRLNAGDVTKPGDFYLTAGGATIMADMPGQNGLVDLGEVGDLPLHHVTLPDPASYKKDGVPPVLGHTYAALLKDGQSVMVFTITGLDLKGAQTIGIIWRPGKTITGACQPLANAAPGGACVSNDGICDPTCTSGRDADCGGNQCVSGDGVCVADCGGTASGGGTTLVSNTGAPFDQACETCQTTYYNTDTDCSEGKSWSDTFCQPTTNVVCQPPCLATDPACNQTPPPACDPAIDPNHCVTQPSCDPATDPNHCVTQPSCDPQTDPNHCVTQPSCDPATDPNHCGTTTPPPCVPGVTAANNPNCDQQCFCDVDPATGGWNGNWVCTKLDGSPISSVYDPVTCPLPPICGNGVIESGEQCESDSDCGSGATCNNNCKCKREQQACTCVQSSTAAANIWFCKENPNRPCTP